MLNLLSFKQASERKFVLKFDRIINNGSVIFKKTVPGNIEINTSEFSSGERVDLKVDNAQLVIDVPASVDMRLNEYSIILILGLSRNVLARIMSNIGLSCQCADSETHYLEIVRQPAAWLKSTFDFDRPKGYSILGRRTINVGATIRGNNPPAIEFKTAPNITAIINQEVNSLPSQITGIPELLIASKIITTLWNGEMQDSPTDKSYSDFIQQPFEKKLQQIHKGEFPVSCQGIRDMFLHAALGFPDFQARAVNACNYAPQFEDLVAYAHATAEVYVSSIDKWVLTDPWTGFMLINQKGEYLSAEDFSCNDGQLFVLPLIEQIVQSHMGPSKVVSKITRRPSETVINEYTYTQGGHVPNLNTYFRYLEYIRARLNIGDVSPENDGSS